MSQWKRRKVIGAEGRSREEKIKKWWDQIVNIRPTLVGLECCSKNFETKSWQKTQENNGRRLFFFPVVISFFCLFVCFKFYFIFKLYNIVLVLPNIEMNPPQVYLCSPSWTLLPLPSPYHPSGSSQCTSPKHPVLCIEPGLATCSIYDIICISMPFSQNPTLSLSHRVHKTVLYISVSFAVSYTGLLLPSF